MTKGFCILVVAGLLALPMSATAKRPPTIDELIALQTSSTPSISPDGRFVAYTVRRPDWKDNAYEQQIWLANTEIGQTCSSRIQKVITRTPLT
jgi:Tol biopolymer transport system component